MTTIVTKNGSGAPLASDLVQGELAVDLTNKRLYTENSGGSVIELGSNPTSLTTGTFTSTGIDDNATSTAITIDSSENVGIGETTPSTTLTKASITTGLVAEGAVPGFCIQDTSGVDNAGYWFQENGTMVFQNYGTGNTVFRTGSVGTETMRIDSSGNVGIGGNGTGNGLGVFLRKGTGANFFEASDGTKTMIAGTDGANNFVKIGSLSNHPVGFVTNNGERMRIDSSGNVGIGTNSPSDALEVRTVDVTKGLSFTCAVNSSGSPGIRAYNDAGDYIGITTSRSGAGGASGVSASNQLTIQTLSASPLVFRPNTTESMRIDTSGNLLVGQATAPNGSRPLAVYGGLSIVGDGGASGGQAGEGVSNVIVASSDSNTVSSIDIEWTPSNTIATSLVDISFGAFGREAKLYGVTYGAAWTNGTPIQNDLNDVSVALSNPSGATVRLRITPTAGSIVYPILKVDITCGGLRYGFASGGGPTITFNP